MKTPKNSSWIEEGYHIVAYHGFSAINVASLARKLDKSKSSFYHYFGDIELFEEELLKLHEKRTKLVAGRLKDCERVFPDMVNIAIEFKDDLFFHKQLRINRDVDRYRSCFEQAFLIFEDTFLDIWAEGLNLSDRKLFARSFLHLVVDNFLLRITHVTFTFDWIMKYLQGATDMLQQMKS